MFRDFILCETKNFLVSARSCLVLVNCTGETVVSVEYYSRLHRFLFIKRHNL